MAPPVARQRWLNLLDVAALSDFIADLSEALVAKLASRNNVCRRRCVEDEDVIGSIRDVVKRVPRVEVS